MRRSFMRLRASREPSARVVDRRNRPLAPFFFVILVVLAAACAGAPYAPPAPLESGGATVPPADPTAAAPQEAAPPPLDLPAPAPANPAAKGQNAAGDMVLAKGDPKLASKFPVFTDPGQLPSLHADRTDGDAFPLEHTDVRALLSGDAADVEVTQTFKNPKDHPIEAVYVFPLPENAAVHKMRLTVGDRVIDSIVQERVAAKKTYETAKKQGYTAALLEQERSSVFTQSVANIEPGKKVTVTVRYTQELTYDAGIYEFVFPMVVGPRYIPGAPTAGKQQGTGTKLDTQRVPDASRVSPAYATKGLKPGSDISLEVVTAGGLSVGPFEVPNQKVKAHRESTGVLDIRLAEDSQVADRDFVLRYRVAGQEPRSTMQIDEGSGFYSLMLVPPNVDVEDLVGQRELVFVVDVSGSMLGQPLERCKEAMREALTHLRPVDTFNIMTFSGRTAKAFSEPRKASSDAIREGLEFVSGMRAGGGTEMLDAVAAALAPDVGSGRHRYVFFMTDGFVGEEDQIMKSTRKFVTGIEQKGKRAKVFGFGVGSSPNRTLIEGLSREGKGVPVYASNREDPRRAVNQFFRYIDRSVLRDVKIDFGSNGATDPMPKELPDLFASRPLVIHGRFSGKPKGPVSVHAESAKGPVEIPVTIVPMPPAGEDSELAPIANGSKGARPELLGVLWARSKVTSLESDLLAGSTSAQADITKLGLEFGLVTRFTSFVAVDWSKKVNATGKSETIAQPVRVPDGVDPFASGALGNDEAKGIGSGMSSPTQAGMEKREAPDRDADGVADQMDAETTNAPAPPAFERGMRGCNCRMEGDGEAPGDLAAIVSLFVAGTFALRTRTRRRAPPDRGATPRRP